MKLYDVELSGNCYKVRLFAALAGVPLELVPVDLRGGEHKRPPFLALNPWGEVPVLADDDVVLRDSHSILVYLAGRHGGEDWLPRDPGGLAEAVRWLSTAANELQHGPGVARRIEKFGGAGDKGLAQLRTVRILGLIDAHLVGRDWLVGERPTIADCAVFPYVALAPEGGVSLEPYANIRKWIGRVQALPGYVPMPGT